MEYTKLSALVGSDFEVKSVEPFVWKKWDNENKKMLVSEKWEEGFSKKYKIESDKGILDLSSAQLANMLESASIKGVSDLNGRTFNVKSNGKEGMEIRYFLNVQPKEDISIPDEWQ